MSLRNDLRGELVAHQCPASDEELVLLLSWLQQQDVDTLGDLRCAGDLSNLEGSHLDIDLQILCKCASTSGASALPGNILEFLQEISDGKRKARRLQPPTAVPKPQAPELDEIERCFARAPAPQVPMGPAKALERQEKSFLTEGDRAAWIVEAEKMAISSSCPKSRESTK